MPQPDNRTIYGALGRHPVHPFPARMAPEVICKFICDAKQPIKVLDPMMGSGTVLALAQSRKHKAIGIDIDPLAALIANVWTTQAAPETVCATARLVVARAKVRAKSLTSNTAFPNGSDEATQKFIQYWFDLRARKQLWALADSIRRLHSEEVRNVLWCAFSRLIISKNFGASRALDLAHSRPHRHFKTAPLEAIPAFMSSVEHVLANMCDERQRGFKRAKIQLGDARALPVKDCSIDLVLTSPPYLNAIDYIRCSKFSLVWMGHSVDDLSLVRRESVGTEVGLDFESDDVLVRIIRKLRLSKLSNRQTRMIAAYVADMRLAINEVARVLVPGGRAVYVVGENTIRGVYVKNSAILSHLASDAGLKLKSKRNRPLPANKRYMPPPKDGETLLDTRMRSEVILQFEKPKRARGHGKRDLRSQSG